MRALWSDRQNCSHNMSQKFRRIKHFSEPGLQGLGFEGVEFKRVCVTNPLRTSSIGGAHESQRHDRILRVSPPGIVAIFFWRDCLTTTGQNSKDPGETLSGPVRDTPPYRATRFRDSIAEGDIARFALFS